MSEVRWMIGGQDLSALGVTVAGGAFRSLDVSYVLLDAALDFDAAKIWSEGDTVSLVRSVGGVNTTFFKGKVRKVPRRADPSYEGHSYVIEDLWRDLEMTTYQERWPIGDDSILMPTFILGVGMSDGGEASYLNTGTQVTAFVDYAAGSGVGVTPSVGFTGNRIVPSEERNVSCAEGIRMALKYRTDVMSWVDYSTTTPTLHFQSVADMDTATITLDGSGQATSVSYSNRTANLPSQVRIIYELATTITDDEGNTQVYRDAVIDAHPSGGTGGGPGVLVHSVKMEGLQAQIQKSRIQVREIPTGPSDANVKAWLKLKFPHMKDVPDTAFTVTKFDRALVDDGDEDPDPINPNATKLSVANVDKVPNELVRGTIEDWMRVRVADVAIEIEIKKAGDWSSATDAAKKAWKKGVKNISRITATNAQTKIYKGIAQWCLPAAMPAGVALDIYNGIHGAGVWEGSVTITEDEIGAIRYHGKKLNLTGTAEAGLATMAAPIHEVAWDVATGETRISFGPNPFLSPQDYIEYQRSLRTRPVKWWSLEERESNEHGWTGGSSANGDTVSGYEAPKTEFEIGTADGAGDNPFGLEEMRFISGNKAILRKGVIRDILTTAAATNAVILHEVEYSGIKLGADTPPEIPMGFGDYLYVNYQTDKTGGVKSDPKPAIVVDSGEKNSTHYQPTDGDGGSGADGDYYVKIGQLTGTSEEDWKWVPWHNSDIEHYHDLWTGLNIGSGVSLYKGRNATADQYEFHKAKPGWGSKIEASGEDVKWDFLGVNGGTGEGSLGCPVLVDTDGEGDPLTEGPAVFRPIRERVSTVDGEIGDGAELPSAAQIHVKLAPGEDTEATEDAAILVTGNGFQATKDWISVQDGLVTAVSDDGPGGDGYTGDWAIRDCDGDPMADPPTLGTLRAIFKYTGGRVIEIKDMPTEEDLGETVKTTYLQSCHWVDDIPHSHS